MLIDMAHDGLGFPVRIPVLVARGVKDGPTFGVTAALHGNELNGMPVIHGLMRSVSAQNLRGTVVGVVAMNPPGVVRRQRAFSDDSDLNHIMPGRHDGTGAQAYAHRIIERIVRHFDYLVDLHTASFGRANCLYIRADMTDETIARMAYLQRPQIIVHNPPNDLTLRGMAQELGIPAITLEIGNPHRFQSEYIRRSRVGLRAVLSAAGMVQKRPVALGEAPVLCERSYWFYTDHGGLLEVLPPVTDRVEEGEVVARLSSVFGDVVRSYLAPQSGVVIGKSVDPIAETGARILHLGLVTSDDHPYVPRDLDTILRLPE
ncbi:MAG: succinylglutamate desuccinylase/aspartoacylase family protein [Alphaproteobacteria bacterium]|nr:succinylglutamate desuccinylase/aspartoacylase family protein [Alphaproteobacteria bacterium]